MTLWQNNTNSFKWPNGTQTQTHHFALRQRDTNSFKWPNGKQTQTRQHALRQRDTNSLKWPNGKQTQTRQHNLMKKRWKFSIRCSGDSTRGALVMRIAKVIKTCRQNMSEKKGKRNGRLNKNQIEHFSFWHMSWC